MAVDGHTEPYSTKRAPGHILADEDYADAVVAAANAIGLPGVSRDAADKAGLVAVSWDDDERDPGKVVDEIRVKAPELHDAIGPDHTVGVVVRPDTGEEVPFGTSAEMGGPASAPKVAPETSRFQSRRDTDLVGSGVTVGIVDSGIVGHPWFDGAFLASPGSIDPLDEDRNRFLDRDAGHGTFITGLILRQAPAATVRVARAFDLHGFVRIRRAANAIVELDQLGADLINLSFGGYSRNNRPPVAYRKAFSKVRDTTVIVAAAGNHNPKEQEQVKQKSREFWPGAMDRVLAVAALDNVQEGRIQLAPFSNYGQWVDLSAVGTDLLSTFVKFFEFNGWAIWSGTSFAAPVVAGRIAAAMTDDSGARVRSAQEAKDQVLEEAVLARQEAGLTIGPDTDGPILLPQSEPSAAY